MSGSHDRKGLGQAFLRHVERTGALLYIIDSAGVDGRDPVEDLLNLREELERYSPELLEKPSMIIANKIDLEESRKYLDELDALVEMLGADGVVGMKRMSLATGEGLAEAVMALRSELAVDVDVDAMRQR